MLSLGMTAQQNAPMNPQTGVNQNSTDKASMDSTSQTGHNGADWQEEIYLKIQALREAHLAELQKFHLRVSQRYEQTEMLPHEKRPDNFEKLRRFKFWLDGLLAFLQISNKSSIKITYKEKLSYYEKQILGFIRIFRRRDQQQLKQPDGHAQSSPQHQPSQVLLSAVTSRMQHGSMTLATLADPPTQQNATNLVQSAFELDHVQVNSFGSLQQGSVGSVQQIGVGPLQNSISPTQQTNLNNLYCASMDSTAQTGHNGADWQEEIYLKIQSLREAHLAELQEFYLKISQRFHQDEMSPQAMQSEKFEKLKNFKMFLERVLALLQISKSNITIKVKEKLPYYEKQISGLLSTNRRPRLIPVQQQVQQQLQHPVGHAQTTPQHQPSQVLQVQQHENHGNQALQFNMPVSIRTIELEVPSRMQHGSVTSPTSAAPASRLQQILSSLPFNWNWSK